MTKRAKQGKARFRVGQVVHVVPQSNRVARILGCIRAYNTVEFGIRGEFSSFEYEVSDSAMFWPERQLRPLTARERGEEK